jgi:hypothetical protein
VSEQESVLLWMLREAKDQEARDGASVSHFHLK